MLKCTQSGSSYRPINIERILESIALSGPLIERLALCHEGTALANSSSIRTPELDSCRKKRNVVRVFDGRSSSLSTLIIFLAIHGPGCSSSLYLTVSDISLVRVTELRRVAVEFPRSSEDRPIGFAVDQTVDDQGSEGLALGDASERVGKTKDEGIDRQEEERLEEGAVKPESRAWQKVPGAKRSADEARSLFCEQP
ncbi:hypothetical protein KM043_000648 [Ampulex compressa]|nr:hypothetical protein KM043_000648 [Ampulex compressa]